MLTEDCCTAVKRACTAAWPAAVGGASVCETKTHNCRGRICHQPSMQWCSPAASLCMTTASQLSTNVHCMCTQSRHSGSQSSGATLRYAVLTCLPSRAAPNCDFGKHAHHANTRYTMVYSRDRASRMQLLRQVAANATRVDTKSGLAALLLLLLLYVSCHYTCLRCK